MITRLNIISCIFRAFMLIFVLINFVLYLVFLGYSAVSAIKNRISWFPSQRQLYNNFRAFSSFTSPIGVWSSLCCSKSLIWRWWPQSLPGKGETCSMRRGICACSMDVQSIKVRLYNDNSINLIENIRRYTPPKKTVTLNYENKQIPECLYKPIKETTN